MKGNNKLKLITDITTPYRIEYINDDGHVHSELIGDGRSANCNGATL